MVVATATDVAAIAFVAVVAVVILVWYVLARVFGRTRAGRHAAHFLDSGDGELSPEDRIKFESRRPGAGGAGSG
jgi:hypothetical protein